jgi:hypothetical protein
MHKNQLKNAWAALCLAATLTAGLAICMAPANTQSLAHSAPPVRTEPSSAITSGLDKEGPRLQAALPSSNSASGARVARVQGATKTLDATTSK